MRFRFYTTTGESLDVMLRAMRKAEKSICLEHFIFNLDDSGLAFIDVLRERARNGVDVRVLVDTAGSYTLWTARGVVADMRKDGVKIEFFNTFLFGPVRYRTTLFFRDHSKLLIVDGKVGYTGGICIVEAYKGWRDTMVEVEGDVVAEMSEAFGKIWKWRGKHWYNQRNIRHSLESTSYVRNLPLPGQHQLYHQVIEAIRTSQKSVWITTPYFVPNGTLRRVLLLAVHRGVDVRVLIPLESNHRFVDYGGQSFYTEMLRHGVKIYRYTKSMMHAKSAVVDNDWATVGSMNFDNLSLTYNVEANIVSTDSHFVAELTRQFLIDIEEASLLTEEMWMNRPLSAKLKSLVFRMVRLYL